ncbi:hypothetical protein ACT8ZV_07020 [Nocardioides sp. MAHUQ-72]|uniref:hypothetical protein n=1 Tax=unclassified Nocardioides TaxID=2615069 RepID=UPI003610DC76
MGLFHKETTWEKVAKPLGKVDGRSVARSGLTAGATMLALSVASAAASAVRRRQGDS